MSEKRKFSFFRGCITAIILLTLASVGSCHFVRYNEISAKAESLPYRPAYSDFIAWEPCDRLFGGEYYFARVPEDFVFDENALTTAGFRKGMSEWNFNGNTGLLCMKRMTIDGKDIPFEAFTYEMYVRENGRRVDYIVPALRLGFGGVDAR